MKTLLKNHGSFEYELSFHLCNRAVLPCGASSDKKSQDILVNAILQHDNDPETCVDVTGPKDHPVASSLDYTNSSNGLILTFPVYESNNQKTLFRVLLGCDSKVAAKDINWHMDIQNNHDQSGSTITIQGNGAPGCPAITLEAFIKFFEDNKYFFAVIFIFIGFFALLAGLRFFNVTVFVLTSFVVSIALTVVTFLITNVGETSGGRWIVFVICVLIGLTSGYIAVKIEKIGFFALGAVLGGVGALFLHTALIHFLNISTVIFFWFSNLIFKDIFDHSYCVIWYSWRLDYLVALEVMKNVTL